MKTIRKPRHISRRRFIKTGAAAAMGTAFYPLVGTGSAGESRFGSRVVIVTDENVLEGMNIRQDIVRIMVDAGLQALTDTATSAEAWQVLFPGLSVSDSVGIKVNCASPFLPSHREVSETLADSLSQLTFPTGNFPLNNILIWERTDFELQAAGYTINTSDNGIRCFGTNHGGIGFCPDPILVNDSVQYVSRCYTDHSDILINLSCLKNHGISGVTLGLKNHYGTVHRALDLHSNACDPWIPALNATLRDTFGGREKLAICDAIFGIRVGGPTGSPQFVYNSLIMSTDPVSVDAVCREILQQHESNTIDLAHHVDTASQAPYELGISDLAQIEHVEIVNPSVPVHADDIPVVTNSVQLGSPFPMPFRSQVNIPVSCSTQTKTRIAVYDLRGRKIQTLHDGMLDAGTHGLVWRAKIGTPSGTYLVRAMTLGRTSSRRISYIR